VQKFGEKLRILRKRQGITLKELAPLTGYATHSHISEIESGKKKPPLEFVMKVAKLFHVSLDHLLNDEIELE
jgi:transcriptional regulator with XRE-family HTH domain